MRQLLIDFAKAVIALAAAFITRSLNDAADKLIAAVQAKGDKVVEHDNLIDTLKAQRDKITEDYIAAHSASIAPVAALRAEANRFQNLL